MCERKLALSDDILMSVEKPARYIGGEVNAVIKDPRAVSVRSASRMYMRSVCLIWECRFSMKCLIPWKMYGVKEFFHPGQIWMPLCAETISLYLRWNPRIL